MESHAVQPPRAQSSIRSFFQPRVPSYTAPPSATSTTPIMSPTANLSIDDRSDVKNLAPQKQSLLPPQATISTIHEKHIQPLRRINSLLLQINYPDSFYHGILSPDTSPSLSRVVLWQDPPPRVKPTDQNGTDSNANSGEAHSLPEPKVIGGIVCRMEQSEDGSYSVYIQSLALLSPYRSKGLATALLDAIIESITTQPSPSMPPATSLYAHVWEENTDGLEWYANRGFLKDGPLIQGYYRKLKPDTAWILRRRVTPSDHLQRNASAQWQQEATFKSAPRAPPATSTPPPNGPPVNGPPRAIRPSAPKLQHTSSFQNRAPDREWNDLPEDILTPSGSRTITPNASSTSLSIPTVGPEGSSSRSSSTSRGAAGRKEKKKREYPAAAFGA